MEAMTAEQAAEHLWVTHRRFMATSDFDVGSKQDLYFNALALAGEVGEAAEEVLFSFLLALKADKVANIAKKSMRGDELNRDALRDELGDMFSYWSHILKCAGFTMSEVVTRSVEKADAYIEVLEQRRAARESGA